MILRPGTHRLRRATDPNTPFVLDYASVSASSPTVVRVFVGDTLVEEVYVGPYSPHTWWANNPLMTERQIPAPGERVTIEVGGGAIFRLESNLLIDES